MTASLYTGRVSHSRCEPRPHGFDYGISMVMVAAEALDRAPCSCLPPLWRWLLPLRRRDHLKGVAAAETPLAAGLAGLVWRRGGIALDAGGSVYLLSGMGFLGHRFNPVSFYFCYDRDGALSCVVAEVTNTPWGEQFHYVLDARGQEEAAELSFSCPKDFHVSPFMPMDTHYRWRVTPPGAILAITIGVERHGRALFSASLDLERQPLSTASLLRALSRQPLMSLSTALRIHWQALRLWLKSTPFYSYPRHTSGDK